MRQALGENEDITDIQTSSNVIIAGTQKKKGIDDFSIENKPKMEKTPKKDISNDDDFEEITFDNF